MNDVTLERPGPWQIFIRIRVMLSAIFFAAIGHGSLIVLLPIDMTSKGVSVFTIGVVMGCYSLGVLIGGRYGYTLIQRVGHHRIYSAMAAIVCIIAIIHSFVSFTLVLVLLRVGVGICMAVIFITLESWLSAISDRNSRGFIYSIYQVSFGLGFLSAPFVATWLPGDDHRSFGLVAIVMSLSLLPLLFSRQPSPRLEGDQKMLPIIEMLRDSPTSSLGAFSAGVLVGPPLTLLTVYLLNLGIATNILAFVYGGMQVGSLLFQLPVGRLADRFNKRAIIMALCLLAAFSALALIGVVWMIDTPHWLVLVPPVMMMGGSLACIYPLTVTFLFEQVESDKAVSAMGSMLVLHTTGLAVGPIIASSLMERFGDNAMPAFVLMVALAFAAFVLYRKLRGKKLVDRESIPYVISLQNQRSVAANLDPRLDNLVFALNNSGLRTLAKSIGIMPRRTMKLLKTNKKALLDSDPCVALESLVLLKPRRCYEIVSAMVRLYPEQRLEFVDALGDVIVLDKHLINSLLLDGLGHGADGATRDAVSARFEAIRNPPKPDESPDEQQNDSPDAPPEVAASDAGRGS